MSAVAEKEATQKTDQSQGQPVGKDAKTDPAKAANAAPDDKKEAEADAKIGEEAHSASLDGAADAKPASKSQPAAGNAQKQDGNSGEKETAELVDQRIEARLSAELDKRIEPLLEVNRKLALFLGEQMQAVIELRQSVRAMERLVEGDARRKGKYVATLEAVRSEGEGMGDGVPDPHWINRTRGMLAQLERTGTLGPKPVDTMKQG